MKRSTDDIIKALREYAEHEEYDNSGTTMREAADRLEALTMPDDATFARIVDAMKAQHIAFLEEMDGREVSDRVMRSFYRAAIRAVES